MRIKGLSVSILLILVLGTGVWAFSRSSDTPTKTPSQQENQNVSVPSSQKFFDWDEAQLSWTDQRKLMVGREKDDAWEIQDTEVRADFIADWDQKDLVVGFYEKTASTNRLTLEFYDPKTLTKKSSWQKNGVVKVWIGRTHDEVLFVDQENRLILEDIKYQEEKILDENIVLNDSAQRPHSILWNQDLAQVVYAFEDTEQKNVRTALLDLATVRKSIISEVGSGQIFSVIEQEGQRWVYYVPVPQNATTEIRRVNLETLEDVSVISNVGEVLGLRISAVDEPLEIWTKESLKDSVGDLSTFQIGGEDFPVMEKMILNVLVVGEKTEDGVYAVVKNSTTKKSEIVFWNSKEKKQETISNIQEVGIEDFALKIVEK